jgi:hypothetical protein
METCHCGICGQCENEIDVNGPNNGKCDECARLSKGENLPMKEMLAIVKPGNE